MNTGAVELAGGTKILLPGLKTAAEVAERENAEGAAAGSGLRAKSAKTTPTLHTGLTLLPFRPLWHSSLPRQRYVRIRSLYPETCTSRRSRHSCTTAEWYLCSPVSLHVTIP